MRQADGYKRRENSGELLPVRTVELGQTSENECERQVLDQVAVDACGHQERVVTIACVAQMVRTRFR